MASDGFLDWFGSPQAALDRAIVATLGTWLTLISLFLQTLAAVASPRGHFDDADPRMKLATTLDGAQIFTSSVDTAFGVLIGLWALRHPSMRDRLRNWFGGQDAELGKWAPTITLVRIFLPILPAVIACVIVAVQDDIAKAWLKLANGLLKSFDIGVLAKLMAGVVDELRRVHI